MAIRVLLADSHVVFRHRLKSLLEWEGLEVVAEAGEGREALFRAETTNPQIVVLDLALPRMNGLDTAREIMRTAKRVRTILMTQHSEDRYVLEALHAGVHGYVLKREAMSDMVHAIRQVHSGLRFVSPAISRAATEVFREQDRPTSSVLTSRERQVLQLVAQGNSTEQAAHKLGISVMVAESLLSRIKKKMGIQEIATLVRSAIHRGLIP